MPSLLNIDNSPPGHEVGVVSDERWSSFLSTRSELDRVTDLLKSHIKSPQVCQRLSRAQPADDSCAGLGEIRLRCSTERNQAKVHSAFGEVQSSASLFFSAFDMLRHRGVTLEAIKKVVPEIAAQDPYILDRVAIDGTREMSHFPLLILIVQSLLFRSLLSASPSSRSGSPSFLRQRELDTRPRHRLCKRGGP